MNYRHGELALLGGHTLPEGLDETSRVLNVGSHGHPHSVVNGVFYVKKEDPNTIGYLVAGNDCYLTHAEHGDAEIGGLKKAAIQPGTYQVRNQVEDKHEGMAIVMD